MFDLKNLSNKEKAWATLIVFAIIAYLFWYTSDYFNTWINAANPWVALVVTIVLNPAYIFLILFLWNEYETRGLIAGLIIAIVSDVISLPHSITRMGVLEASLPISGYSDTILWKAFHLSGQVGSLILYVFGAVAIFYLSLRIIRRTSSFNRIIREAV